MKRILGIALFACAISICMNQPLALTQQTGKPLQDKLKSFMHLKMNHTKEILEGLAKEDFQQIAEGAQALNALSLESSWNTYSTVEYLDHSSDFRRALNVVTSAAHDENLDRAALGYVGLTVQCIECHRYLRQNHSR